jgi:hypothetical protein
MSNLDSEFPQQAACPERSALADETRQKWEELYELAILELERERFEVRIKEAEDAMLQRLEELRASQAEREERMRIQDALSALSVLRRLGS